MKYLALDFETSCEERSSVCAIGYALFEDDRLIERGNHLCKPEPFTFNEVNVAVHGITRYMLKDLPSASTIINRLLGLEFDYLVCHNAEFDMSCLYELSRIQDIDLPEKNVICTMVLVSLILKSSFIGLGPLCDFLDIDLKHHDAGSDAYACGLLLQYIVKNDFNNFGDLLKKYKISLGVISPERYSALEYKKNKSKGYNLYSVKANDINKSFSSAVNDSLKGMSFTFTGLMDSMTRAEASIEILRRSGEVKDTTILKTNYVVIGNSLKKDYLSGELTGTIKKAKKYNDTRNTDIRFIFEDEFVNLLNLNI